MHDDYLQHHGIKGQRWGVRRFQNPDGSLTDAGKKHYSKGIAGRKKKNQERELRRSTLTRDSLRKDFDKATDKWNKADDELNKVENKHFGLESKEERAVEKAAGYERGRSVDPNKAKTLWGEAGQRGKEAEDYYNKFVKPAREKEELYSNEMTTLAKQLDTLDAKHQKMADKYIKTYGEVEYNKLPKTGQEVTEQAVDDFVECLSGNMSKKEYNRKYKGTGFKIS